MKLSDRIAAAKKAKPGDLWSNRKGLYTVEIVEIRRMLNPQVVFKNLLTGKDPAKGITLFADKVEPVKK
jgi:hypothetical protein